MKILPMLGACAAALTFSAQGAFADGEYLGNTHSLVGSFTFNGVTHTVTVPLDQIRYGNGNHKAYLKPEDYKAVVEPPFKGGGKRVTCLKGPGVKAWSADQLGNNGVTCTWKERNGSKFPTNPIQMMLESGGSEKVARNRGLKPNGKTLRGTLIGPANGEYPISLTMDVMDYRNGNSHKAFIKAEFAGQRIDDSSLSGSGIRITGCSNGMHTNGVDVITGRGKPRVSCSWKKGNGRQPSENFGTVVLQ